MRPRCSSHSSGAPEPIVSEPDYAATVIRLSAPPADGPAIVVLLCDAEHRVILALTTEAPAAAVRRVVDLVLQVAEPGGVSAIVVGVVRPRLDRLAAYEALALRGLLAHCDAAGVDLLDVLLVGPRAWRSLLHLAAVPGEGEDGRP